MDSAVFVDELAVDFPAIRRFSFEEEPALGNKVIWKDGHVKYGNPSLLGRGLGNLLSGISEGEESRDFPVLGISLDCSRNGVYRPDVLKKLFRRFALLGYTRVYLYTEDVYQLPGEPAFGAYRCGYSAKEIRDLDDCASRLGLELCASIQTFGHLGKVLRWGAFYGEITDVPEVLLAEEEKTYALIDKMLDFWSSNLRSRSIIIGMDETHLLGAGKYYEKHGPVDRFQVFCKHLNRVTEQCLRRRLVPAIWSDMFFRIASPDGDYYNPMTEIPRDICEMIPEGVKLIYWDYYHTQQDFYASYLQKHRRANGKIPLFGGCVRGARTLWYDRFQTEQTMLPAVAACRIAGVQEFFYTTWSDDGCYCPAESLWMGFSGGADLAFGANEMLSANTERRCQAIGKQDFQYGLIAGKLEYFPEGTMASRCISALLLWDDPLLGIAYNGYAAQHPDFGTHAAAYFHEIAEQLAGKGGHAFLLAKTLEARMRFRLRLLAAYPNNHAELKTLADQEIPNLIGLYKKLSESFREQWLQTYRSVGFETIQLRLGGMLARLEETQRQLRDFLAGQQAEIQELACQPTGGLKNSPNFYSQIAASGYL